MKVKCSVGSNEKLPMGKGCGFSTSLEIENWLSSKKSTYEVTTAPSQGSWNTEESFISDVEFKGRKGSWFSALGRRWWEAP